MNAADFSSIGSVRNAAQEQLTSVDCGRGDLELKLECGGDNQWDCECSEGFVSVPQQRYSRTVVEALTNQTIPLQSIATNTTETTERCYENNQMAERNINKRA